eukprot:75827_1
MHAETNRQNTKRSNKMTADAVLHILLNFSTETDINFKKCSSKIEECLLNRTDEISKLVISSWLKQFFGHITLNLWLRKAQITLQNPYGDIKTKNHAKHLLQNCVILMEKIKTLKIGWNPPHSLLDIIEKAKSLLNNNSSFSTITNAEYSDRIHIKLHNYPKVDWYKIIYGKYGEIKTKYEQKHIVIVTMQDSNGVEIKNRLDVNKNDSLFVEIKGHNKFKVKDAILEYKHIITKHKIVDSHCRDRSRTRDRNRDRTTNRNRDRSGCTKEQINTTDKKLLRIYRHVKCLIKNCHVVNYDLLQEFIQYLDDENISASNLIKWR